MSSLLHIYNTLAFMMFLTDGDDKEDGIGLSSLRQHHLTYFHFYYIQKYIQSFIMIIVF